MYNNRLNRVCLIIIDVLCNTLSDQYGTNLLFSLYIYLIQDLFLLLAIMIILLQFFREDILESNLARVLLAKNWKTLLFILIYFTITIALQTINATTLIAQTSVQHHHHHDHENDNHRYRNYSYGNNLFKQILTILQRLTAIIFYFFLSKTDKCFTKNRQLFMKNTPTPIGLP